MTARHARGPKHPHHERRDRPRRIIGAASERASKWVRVTCPACGVVRVRASGVVMRNCVDDQSWSYRAMCSRCDTVFVASTPSVLALPAIAAGLAVELWTLPTLSGRHEGSPIHAVDALELHLALLEPDWLEQLERVVPLGDC
jgi:transcription elongation factor Elf1